MSTTIVIPTANDLIVVTESDILEDALSGLLLLRDREGINLNNDGEDGSTTQSSNDSITTPSSNDIDATHTFDNNSATPTSSPPRKKRIYVEL